MNRTIMFCAMMAAASVITIVEPMFGIIAFVLGIALFPWTTV